MKKKISRFEFAILQHIEPEKAENFTAITEPEERKQRVDLLKGSASKLRLKTNITSASTPTPDGAGEA